LCGAKSGTGTAKSAYHLAVQVEKVAYSIRLSVSLGL
jgi:hypothetical protein